jgi:hypothetical protein
MSLTKQQFVVTHTNRQNEIPPSLDSRVTNTPSVKISYPQKKASICIFVQNMMCWSVGLLRICHVLFCLLGYGELLFNEQHHVSSFAVSTGVPADTPHEHTPSMTSTLNFKLASAHKASYSSSRKGWYAQGPSHHEFIEHLHDVTNIPGKVSSRERRAQRNKRWRPVVSFWSAGFASAMLGASRLYMGQTVWLSKIRLICCPETSVRTTNLRHAELMPQLHRGGCLNYRTNLAPVRNQITDQADVTS